MIALKTLLKNNLFINIILGVSLILSLLICIIIIKNKNIKIQKMQNTINVLEINNHTLEENNNQSKEVISELNNSIKQYQITITNNKNDYNSLLEKLKNNDLENKKLNIILKSQTSTCIDGLKLNEEISTLKYDDL